MSRARARSASKATGFPIAKIAAKLAVGYRLDEVRNDITRETPASFEPTIDYVVTKFPRWAFEKLPGAPPILGTQMQSVGEVMAIGRTFPESLQKAVRSLETGRLGLNCDPVERELETMDADELVQAAAVPTPDRLFQVEAALRKFVSVERLHEVTGIDPWFLDQTLQIVEERDRLREVGFAAMSRAGWRHAKRFGFSDGQLAYLWDVAPEVVRAARLAAGVGVTYKTVDTCAAEFAAFTPYHYGTYEDEDELAPLTRDGVMILGSGPNRIGQGVEFDYCCVHAAFALRDAGFETVMVNCNPETVSTDYDTSDRLFFEPLTIEDVLNVADGLQRGGRGRREAPRRHRVARWPDSAQARARVGSGGHPDPRDRAGFDRRGRRSRDVQRAVRPPRHPAPRGRHRDRSRCGRRNRSRRRLPRARAPVVRAGWARDGNRVRRHRPAARNGGARPHRLTRPRRRPLRVAARARRPVPRGRNRGGRRRAA